jgi:hypothetical protein
MTEVLPVSEKVSIWRRLGSAVEWLFGLVSLMGLLAVCSVVPLLNFLSLGYLLHVSGRVATTGRLRDGFVGVKTAAVLGRVAVGTWLVLWPLRIAVELWHDAVLISPESAPARLWHGVVLVLAAVSALHIVWSIIRGGRWWHFLWPQPRRFLSWMMRERKWSEMAAAFSSYVASLRLGYCFVLGVKGFFGALLWLAVPVVLMMLAGGLKTGPAVLLSFTGGLMLAWVALYLPFLQLKVACSGRFSDIWQWREVRRWFTQAPWAFWLALLVTLLLALPLYLLKIELTPRDLAWLPSVVFVLFIFPARLLAGWAVSRAQRRTEPRHWASRWLARLGLVPIGLAYGLVVMLMPYVSWNGVKSLLEQHAFMVPAPLMAL